MGPEKWASPEGKDAPVGGDHVIAAPLRVGMESSTGPLSLDGAQCPEEAASPR